MQHHRIGLKYLVTITRCYFAFLFKDIVLKCVVVYVNVCVYVRNMHVCEVVGVDL